MVHYVREWQWSLGLILTVGAIATVPLAASAQLEADQTWGSENSQVVPLGDGLTEIDGGARRGGNLFHSFRSFNVGANARVYFRNPNGVRNILTRVTGNTRSDIFGTLGVRGAANLFLLNPNGVLFGAGATLDVRGAFVTSTANALHFGTQGVFDTVSPNAPPLLTVNPSVFQFTPTATQPIAPITLQPGVTLNGLMQQSLLLIGGDITLDRATLSVPGGYIGLAALADTGTVQLSQPAGSSVQIGSVTTAARGDISLVGRPRSSNDNTPPIPNITVDSGQGGDIVLYGDDMTLTDRSWVSASVPANQGTPGGQGGRIVVDATGRLRLSDNSRIRSDVESGGLSRGGDVLVTADVVDIRGACRARDSCARLSTSTAGPADSGNLTVNANRVELRSGGRIISRTSSSGNAGMVTVNTHGGHILITGRGSGGGSTTESAIASDTEREGTGTGRGGTIWIETGVLELRDRGEISARARNRGRGGDVFIYADRIDASGYGRIAATAETGSGNGGNITIDTRGGEILLTGRRGDDNDPLTGIFADIRSGSTGSGGTLVISTGTLTLRQRAEIAANNYSRSARSRGGNIIITAQAIEIRSGGRINTRSEDNGVGGDIRLNVPTGQILLSGRDGRYESGIFVDQLDDGPGGSLFLNARLLKIEGRAELSARSRGEARGGTVNIEAERLEITSGGRIIARASNEGPAGDINIAAGQVVLSGRDGNLASGIFADVVPENRATASGQGGTIRLTVGQLEVSDRAQINALTESVGDGGDIVVTADGIAVTSGGQIVVRTEDEGDAGNIRVNANRVVLDGVAGNQASGLFAGVVPGGSGEATGAGGNIGVNAQSLQVGDRAQINALTESVGDGGDIVVTADGIAVTSGGQIVVRTEDEGDAGNIRVNANRVVLTGVAGNQASGLFAGVVPGGSGEATGAGGNIGVNAQSLQVGDRAQISAVTQSRGDGGDITLNADRIEVRAGSQVVARTEDAGNAGTIVVTLRGGDLLIRGRGADDPTQVSSLSTSTSGAGDAGNVIIQAAGRLRVLNHGEIAATTAGAGEAGNVLLSDIGQVRVDQGQITASTAGDRPGGNLRLRNVGSVYATNRAEISATTTGAGDAGNLTFQNVGRVEVANRAQITASSLETATGNGGNVQVLNTDAVWVHDGGEISVRSLGSGRAGSLTLAAPTVLIERDGQISASTVASPGGNITLRRLSTLTLRDKGQITASTQSGEGGSISIGVAQPGVAQVDLLQGGRISTEATRRGTAGNIAIDAQRVTVRDTASAIAAASQAGEGGDIALNVATLEVARQGEVSASTRTGQGGNLRVTGDRIRVSEGASLSVEATAGGTAGRLALTADRLQVDTGGEVTVSSPTGFAGDLAIAARQVWLDQGSLTAETGRSEPGVSGANLRLQGLDRLTLRNGSQISADAGADASGGNITIDADFIIAVPSEDSDIEANAVRGRGGAINITTQGVFGIVPATQPIAGVSDITASSQAGPQGIVEINNPNVDPSQGLVELPQEVVDASTQIARTCQSRVAGRDRNTFIVTGRGGLPLNPSNARTRESVLTDWAILSDLAADPTTNPASEDVSASRYVPPSQPLPNEALQEAQAWVVEADGQVQLVSQALLGSQSVGWPRPDCDPS